MRPVTAWLWSGVGAAVVAGAALGQQGQPVVIPPSMPGMPGREVGKPITMPIGSRLPTAGAPVGTGPNGIPSALSPFGQQPNQPQFDLKNVIAPYPGMPKPPPSFWDKLEERWFKLFESDTPAVRPTPWVPGIARRNKEREKERMRWQRD